MHYILLYENKWMYIQKILKSTNPRHKKLLKEIGLLHAHLTKSGTGDPL
jgi:hypothetical protein